MEYINGILFNHKKWSAAIATTWKDLKGIVLSEMSENKIQELVDSLDDNGKFFLIFLLSMLFQNKEAPKEETPP